MLSNTMSNIKTRVSSLLTAKNKILVGVVGTAGAILALVITFAPQPDKKEVLETAWPVTTMSALPRKFAPELSLYGRVETPRQSSLTPAITSHVETVPALEGSWVNKGDLLIQLDPTDTTLMVQRRQADLAESRANLATLELTVDENRQNLEHERNLYSLAKKKSARHEQLRKQLSISEETLNAVLSETNRQAISLGRQERLVKDADNQLARAMAQVSRTEAMLEEAEVNLERTRIVAPFSGRVTSVKVSPGELVGPGNIIVEMYDANHMEIRSQIPASNLSTIKQAIESGRTLSARINLGDEVLDATLARLSGEVVRGRSSVDGIFTVAGNSYLELGRAISLVLILPEISDSLLVPVQSMYGHERVFVVAEDRLKGVTVERLGELKDDRGNLNVLIRAPELTAGIPIVTSQLSNAITGLKVTSGSNLKDIAEN